MRFVAALVLLVGSTLCANAADRITARAWFEDPTGQISIDQIGQQTFIPYQGVLSRGVGESVVWVRITIDPGQAPDHQSLVADRLIVRVRPVYLDHVELFDPLANAKNPQVSGDLVAVSQDQYQSLNLNFVIPMGQGPRDLYLRIDTTSTRLIDVGVFGVSELQADDRSLLVISGLYFGIGALLLFWAVSTWLLTRDRIVFAFIFSQISGMSVSLGIFGYVRLWLSSLLPPYLISDWVTITAIVAVIAASWFYLRLLVEFKALRIAIWGYRVCIGFGGVALLIFLSGDTRSAIQINWGLVTFLPVLGFLGMVFARGWAEQQDQRQLLPRWVLLGYFGINLLILLSAAGAGLGFLPQTSAFDVYAPLTNGIVAGVLAVAVLQYRVNLTKAYQTELLTALAVSQKTAEYERKSREERDRLLAMLGHELKTPLAAIRMLVNPHLTDPDNSARIQRAISEMSSVIDRSVQLGKFDADAFKTNLVHVDVASELEELVTQTRAPGAIHIENSYLGTIRTDAELFRMIITNLLENACKYRAADTSVTVRLTPKTQRSSSGSAQDGVELVVENKPGAAGFPDPLRVFEKYYRSPMAHRQAGSGLGLYLVRGMIMRLGGSIDYSASADRVRFTLWHPL